jgi:hypothetical protein
LIAKILLAAAAGLFAAISTASANSPELQSTTVPPTACQVGTDAAQTTARPLLNDFGWALRANGRAGLLCSLPVARGTLDSFRVLYLDPDGRVGNASVKVFVNTIRLLPPAGLRVEFVCTNFLSNVQGLQTPGWAFATVACAAPVVLSPDVKTVIRIELWRRGGADASFAPSFGGVDFP